MQKEVTNSRPFFTGDGAVLGGWSKSPLFTLNTTGQKAVEKADCHRFFYAESKNCSIFITIEKTAFEFVVKIALRDKELKGTVADCVVKKIFLTNSSIPYLAGNEYEISHKGLNISLNELTDLLNLKCSFQNFAGYGDLFFDLTFRRHQGDSLNLAVPFNQKPKCFYLKSFQPDSTVTGKAELGDKTYDFSNNLGYSHTTLCRLPYRQIYRYVTANCKLDGKNFSLYFGSKLGDDLQGEENCYFTDGNMQKLTKIKFLGSDERIDKIWNFKSGIHAVNITFKPEIYKNSPVFTKCDKTTVVHGSLYGEFALLNSEPVNLTSIPAQMVFTVL